MKVTLTNDTLKITGTNSYQVDTALSTAATSAMKLFFTAGVLIGAKTVSGVFYRFAALFTALAVVVAVIL